MELDAIAVIVAFVIMVVSNVLASTKIIARKDNKEISDSHPTYATPDGTTFAIWGLIYLLELVMVIAQATHWHANVDAIFGQEVFGFDVRQRLIIAFLCNAVWLPFWNNEFYFLSTGIMVAYLASLLPTTVDLSVAALGDPLTYIVFGSGLAMNASWIVVATALSIFFCGGKLGWKDEHGVAGSVPAAMCVVFFVALVAIARAFFQCELAWAFVAAWAIRGIYRMQTVEDEVRFPHKALNASLASFAKWSSLVVVLAIVAGAAKSLV